MTTAQEIFQNQIMSRSGYVQHEARTLDFIKTCVEIAGFQQEHAHVWRRDQKRAAICLVDDVAAMVDIDDFATGDIIVTDTVISRPCNATVIRLPDSWHGIYGYSPVIDQPVERDYSFLINRIDAVRLELMLALSEKIHLHQGTINFNCVIPKNWIQHDHDQAQRNFKDQWSRVGAQMRERYEKTYQRLLPKMPYRNHDFDHDRALQSAKLNIIVETYSSDDSVAFSEKIFTALQLPRPWVLFGGRFAVQRLRHLGFDVLDDLVDHGYDTLTRLRAKTDQFVASALASIHDIASHQQRLEEAAEHNRSVLRQWRQDWVSDFGNWLQNLAVRIK